MTFSGADDGPAAADGSDLAPASPTPPRMVTRDRSSKAEHPTALAAYYTGIFALFPGAGLFMGPPALVLGLKALGALRRDPAQSGESRAIAAILMGALTTLLNWGVLVFFLVAHLNGRN
jgi:uncharacterized protein YqgC (DUF456 family)